MGRYDMGSFFADTKTDLEVAVSKLDREAQSKPTPSEDEAYRLLQEEHNKRFVETLRPVSRYSEPVAETEAESDFEDDDTLHESASKVAAVERWVPVYLDEQITQEELISRVELPLKSINRILKKLSRPLI